MIELVSNKQAVYGFHIQIKMGWRKEKIIFLLTIYKVI